MAVLRNWVSGDDESGFGDPEHACCPCGEPSCDGGYDCPVTAAEIAKLAEEDLEATIAGEDGYEGWTCMECGGPAPAGEPVCGDECDLKRHVRLDREEMYARDGDA